MELLALERFAVDDAGRKIKSATGFRTSGDENHVQLADEDVQFSRDRVSVALPKYSFVTLQIEHR